MFKSMIPWRKRNGDVAVRRDDALAGDYFQPLARLRDEFDALMERFFGELPLNEQDFGLLPSLWNEPGQDWGWNVGWQETDKEYTWQAELPGFEPDDFQIQATGNVLSVRAEHKSEKQEKQGETSYRYGSFVRTVTLPHGVDAEKIGARYHSGILTIHLPKSAEAAGRRIEVKRN